MEKRDVVREILQGFKELEAERTGKLTLRHVEVELPSEEPLLHKPATDREQG